jgi:protein gp37
MGDLFHPEVHDQWLLDIWHIMEHSQQHTFLILTKRPLSARSFLLSRDPMKHIWIGVTAENQARADERIPILLSIPAAVHFVSCEPLLEPVDIGLYLPGISRHYSDVLNWVIAGPETGQKPRECKPEWITDLWRQCQAAGVPFFDKREQFIERRWPKN